MSLIESMANWFVGSAIAILRILPSFSNAIAWNLIETSAGIILTTSSSSSSILSSIVCTPSCFASATERSFSLTNPSAIRFPPRLPPFSRCCLRASSSCSTDIFLSFTRRLPIFVSAMSQSHSP
ncbi:hypothetical protein ES707_14982 [subsurface metagenome]